MERMRLTLSSQEHWHCVVIGKVSTTKSKHAERRAELLIWKPSLRREISAHWKMFIKQEWSPWWLGLTSLKLPLEKKGWMLFFLLRWSWLEAYASFTRSVCLIVFDLYKTWKFVVAKRLQKPELVDKKNPENSGKLTSHSLMQSITSAFPYLQNAAAGTHIVYILSI